MKFFSMLFLTLVITYPAYSQEPPQEQAREEALEDVRLRFRIFDIIREKLGLGEDVPIHDVEEQLQENANAGFFEAKYLLFLMQLGQGTNEKSEIWSLESLLNEVTIAYHPHALNLKCILSYKV